MSSQRGLKLFISYSHQDVEYKNELVRYLHGLQEKINLFFDDNLMPGDNYAEILPARIADADIILLLVSNAYLNSETIMGSELPVIMKRLGTETRIIPVILEPCNWQNLPIGKLQALPKRARPVSEFKERGEAYTEIVNAIDALVTFNQNRAAVRIIEDEKKTRSGFLPLKNISLSAIPLDLLEMPWLKSLDLSGNQVSKMENLDNLVLLERLDLSKNNISKIENTLQLVELKELILSNNEIELIENLYELKKLERLELQHNKVVSLEILDHNTALKILGVSSNQIQQLKGIEALANLEALYVAHNQVVDLSPLTGLKNLKRMVFTNNQIRSIKPLLEHIKQGLKVAYNYSFKETDEGIFIKDNSALSEPSVEVIESGRDAVLKYFKDADRYGVKKLEIVKLVLVGNSRVGKTNLSEYLRTGIINFESTSTHLLDIQSWDAPFLVSDDNTKMHVNIFDFGGQDYYHDSHRMYYSHDTAYLLLWDTTTNKYAEEEDLNSLTGEKILYENFPLEYWLESINYNLEGKFLASYKVDDTANAPLNTGKAIPILVLQNKIDIEEGRLDQKMLSGKYGNIWGYFNMSLAAKKRTAILNEVLSDYMRALNLSGRRLINFEIDIVNHYMQASDSLFIISLDAFWRHCKTIINDDTIEFNKDNARIMAQILNNTGIVLYEKIGEEEGNVYSNIKILNGIVKQVMDVAKTGNDKGIFKKDQVVNIEHRDAIIGLLIRNNSIIQINENEFLAPQFLPVIPDPSIQFFLHTFSFTQMRFVYTAYFHKTFLLNLFSKYLKGENIDTSAGVKSFPFWRNGIIIRKSDEFKTEMVLVEFVKNADRGIVNIRTMKPYSKNGLEKDVENTLDQLNKGWTVDKQISADSQHFFSLDYLRSEAESKQYSFTRNKKNFSINDFKHIADFKTLPKRLFISYSSKNSDFTRRFVTHLEVLKAAGLIDPWYDRMIETGTKWDEAIRTEMKKSDIIIFLLSPDFLATEYVMKEEIPLAIEQFKNSSKFFFVQLLPCSWEKTILFEYQQTDDAGQANKNVISIDKFDNDGQWKMVIDRLEAKLKAN